MPTGGTRLRRRVGTTLKQLEETYDELMYDRRLGIDTGGILVLPDHDEESRPYQAVRWRLLARILRGLDLNSSDVFLDAGCGKGRAVLQAARVYPFARSVGFDFAPELIAVAQANLEKIRPRLKCPDVEFVIADAATWPIPDDVTVILANSPFKGELFTHFLGQVLASVERAPRRLRLIYMNPFEPERVERTSRFQLRWASEESFKGAAVQLYEIAPA